MGLYQRNGGNAVRRNGRPYAVGIMPIVVASFAALAVCRSCPVVDECRAFADDNNRISGYPLQGIWGGKQYGRTSRPRKERE